MGRTAEVYVEIRQQKNTHEIDVVNVYCLTISQEIHVLGVMVFHIQIRH